MKRFVFVLATLLAVAASHAQQVQWGASLDQGMKLSAATNRLVMVDFHASWCLKCHKLDNTTYRDPVFVRETQSVIPVRIDVEHGGGPLAAKYHITGYPAILFLDSHGAKVWQVGGYLPAMGFSREIEFAEDIHKHLASWEKAYSSGRAGPDVMEHLALVDAKSNKDQAALSLANRAKALDPSGNKGPLAEVYEVVGLDYLSGASPNEALAKKLLDRVLAISKDGFLRASVELTLAHHFAKGPRTEANRALRREYLQAVLAEQMAPESYKRAATIMLTQL